MHQCPPCKTTHTKGISIRLEKSAHRIPGTVALHRTSAYSALNSPADRQRFHARDYRLRTSRCVEVRVRAVEDQESARPNEQQVRAGHGLFCSVAPLRLRPCLLLSGCGFPARWLCSWHKNRRRQRCRESLAASPQHPSAVDDRKTAKLLRAAPWLRSRAEIPRGPPNRRRSARRPPGAGASQTPRGGWRRGHRERTPLAGSRRGARAD